MESDAERFKRAYVRRIDSLWREAQRRAGKKVTLEELLPLVEGKLNIPASAKKAILADLRETEQGIAEVWKDFFGKEIGEDVTLKPGEFEKLSSLYQVDFPTIQEEQRDVAIEELRRSVRAEHSFGTLRRRIIKRGLGAAEAQTLANTSLAQFDNAMMFEFAGQAGVLRFLYDGADNPSSRPFCKKNVGKIFTMEAILKMDNGQGLPVLTSLGGYNCTHFWTPVIE